MVTVAFEWIRTRVHGAPEERSTEEVYQVLVNSVALLD